MTEPALILDNPYEIERRKTLLQQPNIKPLTQFVEKLRAEDYGQVPYFDPLDGGVKAKMLFLLEKPGKAGSTSSGIMSRDNATQSCKNIRRFMTEAGIERTETLMWNVVPGWNGTQAIKVGELQRGIGALNELIAMLPNLSVVVCVGRRAQSAQPFITKSCLTFFSSHHPSPNNFAAAFTEWSAIPGIWRQAQVFLEQQQAA